MAVSAKPYGNALRHALLGDINLSTDTLKAALLDGTYTPNVDHEFRDDLTGEVSGTGYTAGGTTLTNVTVTYDAANDRVVVDCDDPTWADSTITARTMVAYVSTGNAATDVLLSYASSDVDVESSSGEFRVELDAADGIFYGSV